MGSGILLLWMVSGIHQNLGTGCRNSSPVCREFGKSYVLEVNKRAFSGVSYESKLHSGRTWLYNWNCQVINRRANSDQRYATVNKTVRALVSLFLAATDESCDGVMGRGSSKKSAWAQKPSRGLGCQRGERNPASPSFYPPLRQTELLKSYFVFELAPKHY